MQIKDVFNKTYKYKILLPAEMDGYWIAPVDFQQHQFNTGLMFLLDSIQNIAQRTSIDYLSDVTFEIFDDIQEAKDIFTTSSETIVLEFYQWWIAEYPIASATMARRFSLLHKWLIYSLWDIRPHPLELDSGVLLRRFSSVLQSPDPSIQSRIDEALIKWLSSLYYYSRKTGALSSLAVLLNEISLPRLMKLLPDENAASALVQILGWSTIHNTGQARALVALFEDLLKKQILPSKVRKILMIALATTSPQYPKLSPGRWAQRVLKKFGAELIAHEPLQLTAAWLAESPEFLSRERKQLFDAIERNHKWNDLIESQQQDRHGTSIIYVRQRLFQVLAPLIRVLIERSSCLQAQEILAAWKRVPEGERRSQSVVFACPLKTGGTGAVCYATEGILWKSPAHTRKNYLDMMSAMNKFLQLTISINDAPDFELEMIDESRMGIPIPEYAEAFENNLIRYYRINEVNLKDVLRNAGSGLILLPGMPHPIQPIMIKHWGYSWPLVQSFTQSQGSRPIRQILLWPSAGLYTADMECDDVRDIFRAAGMAVTVVSAEEQTTERFRNEYASSTYDCIWVISHGEYDHINPHKTSFPISDSHLMNLDNIFSMHINDKMKKLLVLNLCSGGTAATYGANSEMGIAAAMATTAQAVISHIWPVNWLAAWVFGVLLADALVSETDSFSAFTTAVRTLSNGSTCIMQVLRTIERRIPSLANLCERFLHNNSIDFSNLSIWGSPIFIV